MELTGENLYRDPYPVYARLREEAPVAFFEGTKEYLVTRFEDCRDRGIERSRLRPVRTARTAPRHA